MRVDLERARLWRGVAYGHHGLVGIALAYHRWQAGSELEILPGDDLSRRRTEVPRGVIGNGHQGVAAQ